MTYAIFSDIHGNHPALIAALADAKARGADSFIFIGDYASRFPWGDDVVSAIRKLAPAHIIRGNGEGYYSELLCKSKADMTNEQYKPIYWSYNVLSAENLAYLLALPETAVISHEGIDIYLAHSIDFFYHPAVIDLFHTMNFSDMMLAAPFTHDEYLARGRKALLSCPDTLAGILALPKGVHLFGHNHLQFYIEYEGRLFINPGSCGMAADWDATAAYTLLTLKKGAWFVEERRVSYDLDAAAQGFITSGYHSYAPVWSDVTQLQMYTGKEYFGWFVVHLNKTRETLGKTASPQQVWDIAVKKLCS